LNELALFSGIGGGILGGKLLGWRTVCAVEQDPYCIAALAQRQNEGFLSPFPIWDDVCAFDGTRWRGIVDVVSGGFPCQDISAAGKGTGIKGSRSGLWSEMARIIGEVRPRFAFIENSPMLVIRGLDTVLCDLAKMGFDAKWGCISATEVGANHKRDRIWIVARNKMADTDSINWGSIKKSRKSKRKTWGESTSNSRSNVADTGCQYGSKGNSGELDKDKTIRPTSTIHTQSGSQGFVGCSSTTHEQPTKNWWSAEPNVGRVVNGMAFRVDRLKAIGNGQVPEVVRTAWEILRWD
tara:strand:- start:206 stop:1090 length:885 start_codon:yes stop_codon:yes gene_type:complete